VYGEQTAIIEKGSIPLRTTLFFQVLERLDPHSEQDLSLTSLGEHTLDT